MAAEQHNAKSAFCAELVQEPESARQQLAARRPLKAWGLFAFYPGLILFFSSLPSLQGGIEGGSQPSVTSNMRFPCATAGWSSSAGGFRDPVSYLP